MKKNCIVDYSACILLRSFGPLVRCLPLGLNFFLGRIIGELFYAFDLRHRAVAYGNLKVALPNLAPGQLKRLTRDFYRAFGQNLLEIFLIPRINQQYVNKYISIEGRENIFNALKKGKGIIFLAAHQGSWELSSIISAIVGFNLNTLVRDQNHPRLDKLLNAYRRQKGGRIIQRQNQLRQLIAALKNNQAVAMTIDQGGKSGVLVKFFGKNASMSSGALRMAFKYDTPLLPIFSYRIKGPYAKIMVGPAFELEKRQDAGRDIENNLQKIVHWFQEYILRYPQEYLWTYKIWKYTNQKDILILSDGKAGHLRQSEAVAGIIGAYLGDKGISIKVKIEQVFFKTKLHRHLLSASNCLADKYHCQGCLWCLKACLSHPTYDALATVKPDIIISSGSSLAGVNFVLARENLAKSLVIMRPPILSTRRFDLVIMPAHDRPPKGRHVVATEGALNLIDPQYLKDKSEELNKISNFKFQISDLYIGLLIGGNTKGFSLDKGIVLEVIRQVKLAADKLDARILTTTSRRSSGEIEKLIQAEFGNYPRSELLVIASENNPPYAFGGILGSSSIIVSSPESISMISEAVNSKKYVLVFNSAGLKQKHRRFLEAFKKNKYIYLVKPGELAGSMEKLWLDKPQINTPKDNFLVREAIKKIL